MLGNLTDLIAQAKAGEAVAFPTDTVPGLGILPAHAEKIYRLKGRSADKPLILLGHNPDALWPFVQGPSIAWAQWRDLGHQYWPGALTLVLPASDAVPLAVHPQDPSTIGIRVPADPLALQLLAATGPLATTSANLSGGPPLLTASAISNQFPSISVWAETTAKNRTPSTVIKWLSPGWQILRQGEIVVHLTS
ncbi:MAG: L-threonylcarbamoyladenylate synthase [Cyanobacteria bacterium P01_H01_bin.15]